MSELTAKNSIKNSLVRWTDHPVYFWFWMAIGITLWTFSFEVKKVNTQNLHLSSFAENLIQVRNAENKIISKDRSPGSVGNSKFKTFKKPLPKKFQGNPAFMLFEKIEELIN